MMLGMWNGLLFGKCVERNILWVRNCGLWNMFLVEQMWLVGILVCVSIVSIFFRDCEVIQWLIILQSLLWCVLCLLLLVSCGLLVRLLWLMVCMKWWKIVLLLVLICMWWLLVLVWMEEGVMFGMMLLVCLWMKLNMLNFGIMFFIMVKIVLQRVMLIICFLLLLILWCCSVISVLIMFYRVVIELLMEILV